MLNSIPEICTQDVGKLIAFPALIQMGKENVCWAILVEVTAAHWLQPNCNDWDNVFTGNLK